MSEQNWGVDKPPIPANQEATPPTAEDVSENGSENKKEEEVNLEKLFESIDKKGTLFVYGSLLFPDNLKDVLTKPRGPREKAPEIYEATDLAEACTLRDQNPEDIVILRNVLLTGIRAQVITDKQLLEAYEKMFGETYQIDDNKPESYLFVHPLSEEERKFYENSLTKGERSVNGGLIIGLTEEDLIKLDEHEDMRTNEDGDSEGVYMRQSVPKLSIKSVPKLSIKDEGYEPAAIEFYGGSKEIADIHKYIAKNPDEIKRFSALGASKAERSRLFWPHSEKHKVRKHSNKERTESEN